MIIVFVLFGAIVGSIASVLTLFAGGSLWSAFLVYSGVGSAGTLAGIGAYLIQSHLHRSYDKATEFPEMSRVD